MRQATLWLLDLAAIDEATLAAGLDSLGASVQQRYRRFRRPQRQRQFLAGRMLLRQALAVESGVDVAAIRFTERPGAPPLAELPGGALFFSISHADDWVACAVSSATPLGLDIEPHGRQRDFAALAEHSFNAVAAQRIASLPEPDRAEAFYREWCRLESEYKLGQPARYWHYPTHSALAIAVCSVEPVDLLIQGPDVLHAVPGFIRHAIHRAGRETT